MTDKDFASIQARLPALRWRRKPYAATARRRAFSIVIEGFGRDRKLDLPGSWDVVVRRSCAVGYEDVVVFAASDIPTLGRCLRSLECAILREARTLAGMVGKGVTP